MEGGHHGPTRQGGVPHGGGHALDPRGQVLAPPAMFSVPDILKYFRKNHIKLTGHLENFYFRGIFYCMDNQKIDRKYYFSVFILNNRK